MSIDNLTQGINYKGKNQHCNNGKNMDRKKDMIKGKKIRQKRTEGLVRINIIIFQTSKVNYPREK